MPDDPNPGKSDPKLSDIDGSLEQILHSPRFKDSLQLQTLLKYIVDKSLGGHDDELKERIIGMEVFGRRSDYDTADDPIVRSRVGQLRKRLTQYYESHETGSSRVQIVIPNGSYRCTFVYHPEVDQETKSGPESRDLRTAPSFDIPESSQTQAASSISNSSKVGRLRIIGGVVAGCFAITLISWWSSAKSRNSELDLLWGPLVESKRTVILYTGTIAAYLPPDADQNRPHDGGDDALPAVDPSDSFSDGKPPQPAEFVRYPDGLAPAGDIAAALKVAALMEARNRSLSLRSGANLPFVDLKGSPIVLIGAYDNHWTLDIARDLPFFFDRSSRIRERGGQHRVWSSVARADNKITEDYAVIFRLTKSKAGGPVIAVAGLTTCGTQAAAEFVTDPMQLTRLDGVPRDSLAKKNLEFVLRASLVNCTPTSEDIVAQLTW